MAQCAPSESESRSASMMVKAGGRVIWDMGLGWYDSMRNGGALLAERSSGIGPLPLVVPAIRTLSRSLSVDRQ